MRLSYNSNAFILQRQRIYLAGARKFFFLLEKLDLATQKAPSAEGAFYFDLVMPRILLCKLRVIEVIIEAAAGHEALVRALLDDGAFVHHQNEIGV